MTSSIYPIISPKASLSLLREDAYLITNIETFKTKILNKYQGMIISECTGKNSIEEISYQLVQNESLKITEESVRKFVFKMIKLGFLHWSPVKVKLEISTPNKQLNQQKDYFNPDKLHTVTISVTETCCMKCAHCSQSAPFGKGNEFQYDHLVKIVTEAYELGARYLGIFGGEPLLYPYLEDIVSYAYRIGYMNVIIFTKGTLINFEKAKKMRSIGVTEIQVSCDSHIPEQYDKIVGQNGAFEDFYKAIYYLMSVGIKVKLKVVVTKTNINFMPELIDYFTNLNIDCINLEVVVPVGRADFELIPATNEIHELDDHIKRLKESNEDKYRHLSFKYMEYGKPKSCSGGIGSIMIFADGTVAPCDKWYSYRKSFNFGNVYKSTLKDIWYNGNYYTFRNLIDNPVCNECNDLFYCRGGCQLNTIIFGRELGEPDLACSKISGKHSGILFKD
ncbi:radical SAM protein [Tissierella pigra]|uniref:radical SAM/SPASM domain-containing protein n=1 Tax=Tissierella pigra TaxID=2607614 RepID=UPI001C118584|nr:radical SAM protein [Tissierella pigra]MBU5427241.1 radical SAM protein [Tissierella pigra]